ncbi:MAG: HAD family hydrolase, partial [Ruminococcus sp.]|nr:HAD family hydrolase [Ruminococcus sp.]
GKPAPDIYLFAANRLGVLPQACLALEDSPNGVRSAAAAGCKTVLVPDLDDPYEELKELLFAKAENLEAVIELLKSQMTKI